MDDLIQRAQHGDSDAFAALFEQSKQPLWQAAIAVLGDVDDAADALQETAVKAWRAMPRFGGRSGVGTWFMRILLRCCYDIRRKRAHETPVNMAASEFESGATAAVGRPFGESCLVGGESDQADRDQALDVRSAMGKLAGADRLVLSLFYVDDMPIRQIALLMDLSEGAVRTRLSRARDRFKAVYQGTRQWEAEVAR